MSEFETALILVPHQDDEINIAGQLIPSFLDNEIGCLICYSTNGDLCEKDGPIRAYEAINVATHFGIPTENILLLGYPNYDEKEHLYNDSNRGVCAFGRTKTYSYIDGRQCWSERRGIGPRSLTRDSFVIDIADVVETILPDVIICVDFDSHPDHRALSLAFDEAMEGVLRKRGDYSPLVLKKFAYASSWSGPCDYYAFDESKSPSVRTSLWTFELENPNYRWDERLRLIPHISTLTSSYRQNIIYKAFKHYSSQAAWPHFRSVCNSDVVYWVRRTDNCFYKATVAASSGDVFELGGFRRFDVESVCSSLDEIKFVPIGWVPDQCDASKSLSILFSEPVEATVLRVWCSPGSIPKGVVRCLSGGRVISEGSFSKNACVEMTLKGPKEFESMEISFNGLEGPFAIASIEILPCEDNQWGSLRALSELVEHCTGDLPKPDCFSALKDALLKLHVAFYYRVERKISDGPRRMRRKH